MRPWTDVWIADFSVRFLKLQWGHGLAAVDGRAVDSGGTFVIRLQWGHGLAAVDGVAARFNHAERVALQWGHGLAAVDGRCSRTSCSAGRASMGPRPCGRGRSQAMPGGRPARSFNGATALRPWTANQGSELHCRRHGFNGATALRPWTAGRRTLHRLQNRRLQWGHGLAAVDGRRHWTGR